jgi:dienelactone hydrolase
MKIKHFAWCLALVVGLWTGVAQAAVKGEVVTYTIAGEEYTSYLARDTAVSGKQPGIIVVHEWWGHDEYARKRADMLAARGYTALALDMYGTGKLATHPKDAGSFAKEALATAERAQTRFRAAYQLLQKQEGVDADKTAAIGYCFGGKVVLNMARAGMDLKGVVSFHGNLTPLPGLMASPGKVKARVRAFSGADDPFVKPATIKAFKAEMESAGVDYNFVNYPGTVHSFTSPVATARGKKLGLPLAYNAKADGDSWRQTMDFFDEIFK